MRKTTSGKEAELGFILEKRRSRGVRPKVVLDWDFADDIALSLNQIKEAQELLSCMEKKIYSSGTKIECKENKF